MQLKSDVAVAMQAGRCSSDLTSSPGTSTGVALKEKEKKNKQKKERKNDDDDDQLHFLMYMHDTYYSLTSPNNALN